MTKEVLNKLDEKHLNCLEAYKESIRNTNDEDLHKYGKMRIKGYLLALENCNIITQYEGRILYTYFTL